MYKGSDIIGKPMVSFGNGKQVAKIKDIVFDSQNSEVLAFLLEEGGIVTSARVVPFSHLRTIGIDAVMIENEDVVLKAKEYEEVRGIIKEKNIAKGTKIMTEDGRNLGTIADVYFDEKGKVVGYEVSGGIFSDMYSGRSFLPVPSSFRIGKDVAFVPNELASFMEEQVGGIKRAAQDLKERTAEKAGQAREVAQEKLDQAQTKLNEGTGRMREKAEQAIAVRTIDDTLGRRVYQTIRSNSGMIIAAQGQIVTSSIIERVKAEQKEAELVRATDLQTSRVLGERANQTVHSTRENIQTGKEQIKERANSMWEVVRERAQEFTQKTRAQLEEKRIHAALGKPVTRVILDKQDNIILNTGDLITHEAVEKSRRAGVLDILLNSVYRKNPRFQTEDLRANENTRERRDNNIGGIEAV